MPRKYPDVLRQTVIDAVTVMGMPQKEAAATYEVGLSTVQRWVESSEPRPKTTSTTTTAAGVCRWSRWKNDFLSWKQRMRFKKSGLRLRS